MHGIDFIFSSVSTSTFQQAVPIPQCSTHGPLWPVIVSAEAYLSVEMWHLSLAGQARTGTTAMCRVFVGDRRGERLLTSIVTL